MGFSEEGFDLLGENAFAFHPHAPAGVVEFAAAHGFDAAEDFVAVAGGVAIEPFGEKRRDGPQEVDNGVAGGAGADGRCGPCLWTASWSYLR